MNVSISALLSNAGQSGLLCSRESEWYEHIGSYHWHGFTQKKILILILFEYGRHSSRGNDNMEDAPIKSTVFFENYNFEEKKRREIFFVFFFYEKKSWNEWQHSCVAWVNLYTIACMCSYFHVNCLICPVWTCVRHESRLVHFLTSLLSGSLPCLLPLLPLFQVVSYMRGYYYLSGTRPLWPSS